MRRLTLLNSLSLLWCFAPTIAAAQNAGALASPEAQKCAALIQLNLESAQEGPL